MPQSKVTAAVQVFFDYFRSLPDLEEAQILFLSCSDLSEYDELWPTEVNYEVVSSIRDRCIFSEPKSGKTVSWRDLEDELPVKDSVYDMIVLIDWLEYCTWPRWALQKIYYLLKDKGQLVLMVENGADSPFGFRGYRKPGKNSSPFLESLVEKIPDHLDFHTIKKTCFVPRQYPARQMQGMLGSQEFEIQQIRQYNFQGKLLYQSVLKGRQSDSGFFRRRFRRWCLSRGKTQILYHCTKSQNRPEHFKERILNHSDYPNLFKRRYTELTDSLDRWLDLNPQYRKSPLTYLDEPKDKASVFVLSPHPDDEIIGCGGVLFHLIESGHRVVILQLTNGWNSDSLLNTPNSYRQYVRVKEAQKVAEIMGAECICWGIRDGELKCNSESIEKLIMLLKEIQPGWIFTPFINDPHPDHQVCNQLFRAALQREAGMDRSRVKIFNYEVSSLVPANACFRIDHLVQKKEQLLLLYQTGLKPVDYMEFCLWNHAHASCVYTNKPGFVESFLMLSPEAYLAANPLVD